MSLSVKATPPGRGIPAPPFFFYGPSSLSDTQSRRAAKGLGMRLSRTGQDTLVGTGVRLPLFSLPA